MYAFKISPGLYALPPNKFSVDGTIQTAFIEGFNLAIALKIPKTVEEPHISYFISSIDAAGFIDMPPASKVNPFPTSTIGFEFPPLLYSKTMNLGGSFVP